MWKKTALETNKSKLKKNPCMDMIVLRTIEKVNRI